MFKQGGVDIESGGQKGGVGVVIYPGMTEDPQLRWGFIRKVYAIVCTQLFFTAVIATVMFFTPAVKDYMKTIFGAVTVVVLLVVAFIRETILIAAGLTALITVSLTFYTFWAAKRGMDFSFLGPFLFCASIVLVMFLLMQFILHLGREAHLVYSCLAALLFSAYIIYDTNNLIRNFTYDEYVIAAICLFGDIINLFLALLGLSE
ncbi:Transmembrane BAX inhibitor motif-containing protein 4 [Datura stramonium]|uniref:Transmembrane BAX inhibitor motif-containing protein 4 n=1 Tax=Datura stramonium TaxID=4076 RepID=A0ABS8S5G2_DATST|nr:Transmembrane BAX inhibitor motif-containing protein 4 [Datura stramonium]